MTTQTPVGRGVRYQVTIPGSTGELVELALHPHGASRWLGTDPGQVVGPFATFALPGDNYVAGTIVEVDEERVMIQTRGRRATITFERHTSSVGESTRLTVDDPDVPAGMKGRAGEAWKHATSILWLLRQDCAERRAPRQAVVVIHGIGEQRPGSVLRGFTAGLLGGESLWSKPDNASGNQDLRRLQARQTETRPHTDFYELYWADRIRDTTKNQVVGWLKELARRKPRTVPKQFKALYWGGRILVLLALITAVLFALTLGLAWWKDAWDQVGQLRNQTLVVFIATVVVGVINGFLVLSLGDAARYLRAQPDNLSVRKSIRDEGLALMRTLHATGRYHRVVVVGHSLGSVIGYDVLRLYWTEVHDCHGNLESPANTAMDAYEALASTLGPNSDAQAHQDAQHALALELRANGVPWLVTDFITLGSALAHGQLFLATDEADLRRRQRDRELPTCPPIADPDVDPSNPDRYSFTRRYVAGSHTPQILILHHAAPFAPTRWTNLYFPTKAVVFGDPVGGKVAPAFGQGVRDVAVWHPKWRRRHLPWAHSSYWHRKGDPVTRPDALADLTKTLGLDCRDELQRWAGARPLSEFLPVR